MHRFVKRVMGISLVVAWGLAGLLLPAQNGRAQAPGQAGGQAAQPAGEKKKQVKDQAEWELFNSVLKANDPNEKLKLLTTWKEKYPESDYKDDRLVYFIQTYAQLGQFQNALGSAKDLLALDPKSLAAMLYINNLTPVAYPTNPPADALDLAEKAANGLLNAQMPAGTKPEDWAKAKKDLDPAAHKTLGWIAWQRKNFPVAEQQFTQSLQLNPNQGEVSYWLGSALLQSRQAEKQAPALFHIARAVELPAANGGLPDATRKQLESYLSSTYSKYHGSADGLDQLKAQARTNALPPADFKIETGAEVEAAKYEQFKKENPSLALWLNLKKELQGPNGDQFFDSSMKNANVPGGAAGINMLRGRVVSAKPAVASTQLVVALEKPDVPEVTLKLENPVKGKPVIGSQVDFAGVPVSFTKEPFMVTFDQAKVSGLQTEAAAPARRTPGRKKQ